MKKKQKYDFDITIAIINYNRASFLDRSLRSCLEQVTTYNQKIEVIVIDDKSTDDSMNFLMNYKKQIRIFKNKKNMGVGYGSNLAVKKAKGKFFIRVDSDDYLGRLATEIMSNILIENKKFAYVYCDHIRIDKDGFREKRVRLDNDENIRNHGAGILFRTEVIKKVGNYDKNLREGEDYDLISRINRRNYQSFYLPIPLYRYYIHDHNISKTGNRSYYLKKINKQNA